VSPQGADLGTVYGIGLGPGDADLVTVKAARLLGRLPVVAFPANPRGVSLALSIAAPYLSPAAEHLPLVMDFATDRGMALVAYDTGAAAIAAEARAGRDVGVLCEGDPLTYGSFAYILARLPEDVPVEVVPGVSAPAACAAAAQRPLALGDEPLLCLPATLPEDRLAALLGTVSAAALFKVGRHLDKAARALAAAGLAEDAVCVVRASQDGQRRLTLAEAQAEGVPYFSMILARRPRKSPP
jgi:precorrin-2/cobalt-factor-2 C20-methyltransferase